MPLSWAATWVKGSHNPATHPAYKHKYTHLLMAVSDNEYFLQGEIDGCTFLLRWGVEWCEAVGQNDHGWVDVHHVDDVVRLETQSTSQNPLCNMNHAQWYHKKIILGRSNSKGLSHFDLWGMYCTVLWELVLYQHPFLNAQSHWCHQGSGFVSGNWFYINIHFSMHSHTDVTKKQLCIWELVLHQHPFLNAQSYWCHQGSGFVYTDVCEWCNKHCQAFIFTLFF